jgi:hypothetical protein
MFIVRWQSIGKFFHLIRQQNISRIMGAGIEF